MIFKRVSTRKFTNQEVSDEDITKILDAAMSSPSAYNQRAWEFYVVKDKNKLEELSHSTKYATPIKNANVAIVVCYKPDTVMPEYCQIDCAMATENMWLEVTNLGLGAVMIGIAPHKENMEIVRNILNIPNHLEVFTIMPIGYPEFIKEQPSRFDESIIHYIN